MTAFAGILLQRPIAMPLATAGFMPPVLVLPTAGPVTMRFEVRPHRSSGSPHPSKTFRGLPRYKPVAGAFLAVFPFLLGSRDLASRHPAAGCDPEKSLSPNGGRTRNRRAFNYGRDRR